MIKNIVRKIVVLAVSLAAGRLSSFLMALQREVAIPTTTYPS